MKKAAITVLLYACSLAFPVLVQGAFAADDRKVFRYEVELQVPAGQRKLIEDHLDLYRWRGSERMNEAQLRRLVRLAPEQVRTFLAVEGFYSPQVEAEMAHKDSRWIVSLVVDPGEPVRVTGVDLQVKGSFNDGSAENLARLEKMRVNWGLPPGSLFRHHDWEAAKRKALKDLLLYRYPAASIASSRATINPETKSAKLEVILDSGPAFTFGALEIQGLHRYPAILVKHLNPIVSGEFYSQAKLLELQSRLQDSPYFASAAVNVDTDPKQPGGVLVQVKVVEKQSQKLGFGVGMSTDTGARGQVDYRNFNLFDRTWRLGSTLKLEQKSQSFSGDLQFPLTKKGFLDSVNGLLERTDIEDEVIQKLAMGVKRTFVHGKAETGYGIRSIIENQDIEGAASRQRSTFSPFYFWTLHRVDRLLFPTSGYLVNLQADVAAQALLSDQDFFRGFGRVVYFYPISKRDQLVLRGELGMVAAKSRDGIPSDFLFRTGGDQTVRGYAYQSLGVPEEDAVVGGRYLAVGSVEYIHWLTDRWGAALFVDAGNAADSLNGLKPACGCGVGARWKSPVGPLNLDLAYGRKTREMRIHFSMGFSF